PEGSRYDQFDLLGLQTAVLNQFGLKLEIEQFSGLERTEIEEQITDLLIARYDEKERMIGADNLRQAERIIMLNVVDNQWKDHLLSMDHLKEGIGLRGYGQKDPLIEYKKESFTMFQDMMDRIEDETIRFLFFMQPYEGHRPELPYPDLLEEEDEEAEEEGAVSASGIGPQNGTNGTTADQKAAQNKVQDFTRN